MLKENCTHPQYALRPGAERYPLRYGSAATTECTLCKAFKLDRGFADDLWEVGPLSKAVAKVQKEQDENL